jgi:signal transduction histidine kinase
MLVSGRLLFVRRMNLAPQTDRRLHAAYVMSEALSRKMGLGALLEEALSIAMQVADAAAGTIALHDPRRAKLVFVHVAGERRDALAGFELDPGEGVIGDVFSSGAGRITTAASEDPAHTSRVDDAVGYTTESLLTVPLKTMEGEPIGALQLLNKIRGEFAENDLEVAAVLAAQIAAAVENERLHERAKAAEVAHMLGDISHDIKNLMTPIATTAQTLRPMLDDMFRDLDGIVAGLDTETAQSIASASGFVREFAPEAFDMLNESSLTVQARVKELADAVKGVVAEPNFEPADPAEVVARVVAALKPLSDAKGIRLTHEDSAGGIEATIDRGRLFNAVYNLVINAIPETPAGGSITVRTRVNADAYEIVVADTGRGIPPEILPKLFTDQAVSTKPGGTGLGTQVVRKVVEAHGGRVWVESEVGKGSVFSISLPLPAASASGS